MVNENELLSRVEKLEATSRRWKRLTAITLLALGVIILSGQARTNQIVQAQEFALVNRAGRILARLAPDGDGACLSLDRQKGTGAIELCTGKEIGGLRTDASVALSDAQGNGGAELTAATWESKKLLSGASLTLQAPSGQQTIHLLGYSDSLDGPELSLSADSKTHVVLQATRKDFSDVSALPVPLGGTLFLGANETEGRLRIRDSEGFTATVGSIPLVTERTGDHRQTSAASVVLAGRDGKTLWSAP